MIARPVLTSAATLLFAAATATAAGIDVPEGTVVRGETAEHIDAWLTQLSGLGFSGGVIAAAGGEVILSKGYGLAVRESGIPFTTDTRFSIGSITKPITACAILKLQSMGKLSTDDFVSDHFDGLPEDRDSWTLHELLTHTSGLPSASGFDYSEFTCEDLLEFAFSTELRFRPRARYSYSNVGFSVLAAIIEKASGMSYEEFTQKHVFGPAGMTRTGYRLDMVPREEYAHGYRGAEAWGTVLDKHWPEAGPSWHLMGNGGTQSTLRDMFRFHLALLDDTILDEEAREEMFSPYADEGGGESFYGYGWVVQETERGSTCLWHDGGNPYFSNDLRRFVDEDVVYYVHSNNGAWDGPSVSPFLEQMLFGERLPLPPAAIEMDAAALDALAGTYTLESGAEFEVEATDGGVVVIAEGQEAYGLLYAGDGGDVERREALNERTEDRVRDALVGDGDDMLARNVRRLADEHGPIDGVRALGTIPFTEDDQAPPGSEITVLAVRGRGGESGFAVLWNDGQVVGLDLPEGSGEVVCYPVGDGRFESFALGATTNVELGLDGASLVLTAGEREVRAARDD